MANLEGMVRDEVRNPCKVRSYLDGKAKLLILIARDLAKLQNRLDTATFES